MLTNKGRLEVLTEFFRTGKCLQYKKSQFIVRPGELPAGVFYIESGLVKAYDITKYDEENLLIIRKAGEILGLTWAMTGQNRHIIYETLSPTTAWRVSRRSFSYFIHHRPEAALPLLDMVTNMYRLHSERILNLEYRTVRERLISFLLTTAERFGENQPAGGILLNVPLRHQDIASSICCSRETTGRELAELE
ncbi:MAG: Crp/Fnr family transcriptional regulator, partial [Candidatus Saccharimonadales bacterium]